MDDRTAEIREALANPGRFAMAPAVIWKAAKEWADLLDSDALIIRRDDVMTGPAHQLVVTLLDNPDADYLLVLLASPRQVNWCETHNHPIAADIREALDYSMSQPVPCQAASSQGVEP